MKENCRLVTDCRLEIYRQGLGCKKGTYKLEMGYKLEICTQGRGCTLEIYRWGMECKLVMGYCRPVICIQVMGCKPETCTQAMVCKLETCIQVMDCKPVTA